MKEEWTTNDTLGVTLGSYFGSVLIFVTGAIIFGRKYRKEREGLIRRLGDLVEKNERNEQLITQIFIDSNYTNENIAIVIQEIGRDKTQAQGRLITFISEDPNIILTPEELQQKKSFEENKEKILNEILAQLDVEGKEGEEAKEGVINTIQGKEKTLSEILAQLGVEGEEAEEAVINTILGYVGDGKVATELLEEI